ncbi:hypothetical protein SOMG_04649 [Schizosaccharomyces osmophilus]|uniref:Uncharacterized protein n=1 Tax=Schizosaccharomyces osmophilus TaxID=2545709 RepID=A0AAE9WHL1_9SCHI|nr:uncharacterized protein SOMG_04649 [Schizosaccharomyces osmophilus]WBW74976.1 hypothetical protein SOMG_04649 [Schizosaccharomyces osmophilus]
MECLKTPKVIKNGLPIPTPTLPSYDGLILKKGGWDWHTRVDRVFCASISPPHFHEENLATTTW